MQIIQPLGRRVRHLRDAMAGSDPGLGRLRMAASGAAAMASALAVELVFARLRGADATGTMIGMLLGAVVAMMGSMALSGTARWPKVRTAVFFPVAIGVGVVAGVAVSGHTTVMLVCFVAVMFVAVVVRRFGVDFFFYGFMLWMGYFFASFLQPGWGMVPWLVVDAAVGAAWVLLLSVTVLRTNPGRTLLRVRRSFGARGRRLATTAAALLALGPDEARSRRRHLRRLHAQHARVSEAGLMIEAWSAEPDALPAGWSAQALRRRILDAQLALDGIAVAAEELAGATPPLRHAAGRALDAFSRAEHTALPALLERLADVARDEPTDHHRGAARVLGEAVDDYLDVVATAHRPPAVEAEDFNPSVSLAMGNLPGSVPVAMGAPVRGGRWNPLTRLDFTSRQAVQVALAGALAILLGRWLNETRYYWAVIAAFIAFTGTGSRAETFVKSGNRVLGTLVGLVAGIELAHVTAGSTLWSLVVIVLAMFCGFYLVRINYAYMIFFITIMVAQLYGVLHEFSDGLLVLRLEETAIGAFAGILVGLLVAPVSTRDTAGVAQTAVLEAVADLLDVLTGHTPEDPEAETDPDALASGAENELRELSLVALPLVRPLVVGNNPAVVRHRLGLHARIVQSARALAAATRYQPLAAGTKASAEQLGDALRAVAGEPPRIGSASVTASPEVEESLRASEDRLVAGGETGSPGDETVRRLLSRMHRMLVELALPQGYAERGDDATGAVRETDESGLPAGARPST